MAPTITNQNSINEEAKDDDENKDKNNDFCFYNFNTLSKDDSKKKKKTDEELLLSMIEEDEIKNDLIPLEKIYEDLGPMIFKKNINIPKSILIDDTMNSKRIADFITDLFD